MLAAAIIFFAYLGYDAVATMAEEVSHPQPPSQPCISVDTFLEQPCSPQSAPLIPTTSWCFRTLSPLQLWLLHGSETSNLRIRYMFVER